jgi:hypothetical protein
MEEEDDEDESVREQQQQRRRPLNGNKMMQELWHIIKLYVGLDEKNEDDGINVTVHNDCT